MSEQPPEREHNPSLISPIRRYYFDVERTVDDKTNAIMAMLRLTDSLPPEIDLNIESIISSEGMPFEWEYDHDLRIAKEKLAILPLIVIGPQLDSSYCSPNKIRNWYGDAIRGMKMLTKDYHDNSCLESEVDWHRMCASSTDCPILILKRYLIQDTIAPDFTMKMYEDDHKRGFQVATTKLITGFEQGLLGEDTRDNLLEEYKKQYIRYTVPLQLNSQE